MTLGLVCVVCWRRWDDSCDVLASLGRLCWYVLASLGQCASCGLVVSMHDSDDYL